MVWVIKLGNQIKSVSEQLGMLTISLSRMMSSNIRGAKVSTSTAGANMLSDASIDYVDHMANFDPQNASSECEFGGETEMFDGETEMDLSEFNLKGGEVNKLKQKMNEELAQRMKIAKEKAKAKGQSARKKK